MLPGKFDNNADEARKREFKRQQDRLKMMAPDAERKSVTADAMIDSLLQKSDTFKRANSEIPAWARVDSPSCCPLYEKVWEVVRLSDKYVDTSRISQLLLTSGLHPDILGFIWNLANKVTPGQLTKQELYIVLALVGLAQSGSTFNNVNVLNLLPSPPIPRLQLPIQSISSPNAPTSSYSSPYSSPISESQMAPSVPATAMLKQESLIPDDDFQDFQAASSTNESTKPIHNQENDLTSLLSSPLAYNETSAPTNQLPNNTMELLSTNSKPISFQSLRETKISSDFSNSVETSFEKTSLTTKTEKPSCLPLESDFLVSELSSNIPTATQDVVDDFTDFQSADAFDTSIVQPAKISLPKISSFIKVSPESEKKLRNISQPESLVSLPESKISSKNQVSSLPSLPVLGSSRSVGSRLANHTLGNKTHQKHVKVKPLVSASTAAIPSEELFPKCLPKQSVFLLKETKIPSSETEPEDHELTRRIEIPSVGTFKETTLPVHADKQPVNLLNVEEDKYGALRDLVSSVEPTVDEFGEFSDAAILKKESVVTSHFDEVDDFGEFTKVSQLEDFGEFLSADLPSEKAVEAWTAWNSNVPESPDRRSDSIETTSNTITPSIDLLGDSFDLLSISKPTEDSDTNEISVPKIEPQSVARRCLQCCQLLLKEALDVFLAVQDKSVLKEVFQTEKAQSYIKCLNIIYYISKRISMNSIGSENLYSDICDLWRQFHKLTESFSISLSDVEPMSDPTNGLNPCGVCKSLTSEEDIEMDGVRFHTTCANLWINCIEPNLPCF